MRLRVFVLTVAAGLVVVVLLIVAWYVLAPGLDNRLGFQRQRDLKDFLHSRVGAKTVEQVVADACMVEGWEAYHEEAIFLTTIKCRARCSSGDEADLRWEVGRNYSPVPSIPRVTFFICALTPMAARLTPAFAPLGLKPDAYPNPPDFRSAALYGWAMGNVGNRAQ